MKISLTLLDIGIIILYFLLIGFAGIFATRKTSKIAVEQEMDFILAGRKLTLPFFVASLVATWYGNILGIGEFVYRYGLVAWFCFGIVYYISALFYALFVSRRIRSSPFQTIAEQIESKFGKTSGVIASFVLLIITFPSIYVLMVGVFINLFTGLNILFSIIIGTFLTFVYIGYGGFKSNVFTNSLQFILMYLGFGIFLIFSLSYINYDFNVFHKLPNSHLKFFGNVSWQFIISWVFISLQTFVDPSFFQRCSSARSEKIARKGILASIFFWFIFDSMTIMTGLIGRALLPNIDPLFTYPLLMEKVVPPIYKGIVLVSMLATIISTLESYTFLSSLIIGKDILKYFKIGDNFSIKVRIRFGLIITAISSILIAFAIPSAIEIIYKTSSIAVPSLFYPFLFSFSKKQKISNRQANFIILSSAIITFLFILSKDLPIPLFRNFAFFHTLFAFEPMVFGFIWSTIITFSIMLYKRFKDSATTTLRV
ncbi:MAG: sodium:solute symporter family protein [Candidatus Kapaibacteriota bacterium]